MVSAEAGRPAPAAEAAKLPPIAEIAIATMVLVVAGGVYVAAHIPRDVPMGLPIALIVVAASLLVLNVVLVSRIERFAWKTFRQVGLYSVLAYVFIAGMLEFIFVYDNTPGDILALLSAMLLIYAVDIPLLFAFSVARYQDPDD